MRQTRIAVPAEEAPGIYHAILRMVNGGWPFDDVAKEVFSKQLRQVADYRGVCVLTYAILSNHFYVLVGVPQLAPVPDSELLRRFNVLYPEITRYQTARLAVIRTQFASNGPEAIAWRRRQLALMGTCPSS